MRPSTMATLPCLPLHLAMVALLAVACGSGEPSRSSSGKPTPSSAPSATPTGRATDPPPSPTPAATPTASRVDVGGPWAAGVPTLDPRSEHAVAVLDGRIYVAGGFFGRQTTDAFDVLDVSAGTWTRLASMPEARDHTAVVALGTSVYVLGGAILGRGAIRADTWRYDPETDAWSNLAPLPRPRAFHAAAVFDGLLYVVGGIERPSDRPTPTLRYDPARNSWDELAAIPTEREHLAAVAFDGRVYAIGGRLASNSAAMEALDLATGAWVRLPDLPTARSGLAAAVLDGRIHVLGGEQVDPPRIFADHEVFDPVTGSWTAVTSLPRGRHGFGVAVVDGRLYAVAGGPNPDLSSSDRVDVFTPTP